MFEDFLPSGKQVNKKEKELLLSYGMRWCSHCKSVKPISEFFRTQYCCKECRSSIRSNWVNKNPEKLPKWRDENKEKRSRYNQKWNKENKERIRLVKQEWRKQQRGKNPEYNILNALRCRLYQKITQKGFSKSDSTIKLTGCSVKELKIHLEKQFQDGMSWDNYGEWHIDHIKPCSSFDLTRPEEQRKCFHYSNLQPLWAMDNILKGDS
jgi:glutaredoxin